MEHVLIIDDEPSILEFLDYVLRKEGYRVSKASEGKKAREMIREEPGFDLIISDLRMPDVDGWELLKLAQEVDAETPVIYVTAFASSETAIEALKLGPSIILASPFRWKNSRTWSRTLSKLGA